MTKRKEFNNKDIEEAFKSLEDKHLKKINKGYKPIGKFSTYRGSAPVAKKVVAAARATRSTKVVPVKMAASSAPIKAGAIPLMLAHTIDKIG